MMKANNPIEIFPLSISCSPDVLHLRGVGHLKAKYFLTDTHSVIVPNILFGIKIRIPILLLIFISIAPLHLFSQVNTEVFRKEFSGDGLFHQINFDLGIVKGNTEFTSVRTSYRADYLEEKFHHFGVLSYGYAEDDVRKKENRGFIHLRSSYEWLSFMAIEAFFQKEFNEFILLKDRNLLGGGGRVRIINTSFDLDTSQSKKFDVYAYIGFGAMIENEYINTKPRKDATVGRMTSYTSIGANISQDMMFKIVVYYQPCFANFDDYRALSEGSLNFKISKHFSFRTAMVLRYDSRPPLNVKPRDLNLFSGIQVVL